jgi:predicted peptidase
MTSSHTSGFLERSITVDGSARRYVVYVPRSYSPATPIPAIMFLHGSGECGDDGLKQVGQGIGREVMSHVDRWPAIIIFPQKPTPAKPWEDFEPMVMGILASVKTEYSIDQNRIYLTGLSQGGHGTWMLGAMHNTTWAALAPICGLMDSSEPAAKVKDLPIWCFHGDADRVVPVKQSRMMIDALHAVGANNVQYTELPGVDHNSWDAAYSNEQFAKWLFAQQRNTPK